MDALARDAHARGEPIYPQDLKQPPVPDAENAALPILEATKRLRADGFVEVSVAYPGPVTPTWPAPRTSYRAAPSASELPYLKSTIERFQDALDLVRLARGRPKAVFPAPRDDTLAATYQPLAELLVTAADYKHATAEDGQTVEYLRDALTLSDTLQRVGPMAPLELAAVDNDIVTLLERISSELSLSGAAGKEASPQQVRLLIAGLLDDQAMRDSVLHGYEQVTVEAINGLSPWVPKANGFIDRLLYPTYELDEVRGAESASTYLQGLSEPNFQAARAKLKDFPTDKRSELESRARPLPPWAGYPAELPLGDEFRILTERRIVAIMLAIRLYSFDHNGRLPALLSDLVPAYLPAVPCDPFDPANGPIRYLPKRNPPALYSLGFNGKDDGGSEKYLPLSLPVYAQWHKEDVVYPLRLPGNSPAQNHQGNQ